MQRAATGLAVGVPAAARRGLRASRGAARGDGQQRRGRAVRRRRPRPARGAGDRGPARSGPGCTRRASPRSGGPAGGCSRVGHEAHRGRRHAPTSSLDGMLGIGGRGGLRAEAADARRGGGGRARAFPSRSTSPAASTPTPAPSTAWRSRPAHGHLRGGQARPRRRGGPRACRSGAPGRHRSRAVPAPAVRLLAHRRRRRRAPGAAVGRGRQVLAGRRRGRRGIGDVSRCRRALHRGRAAHPAGSRPLRRDGRRRGAGRVAGGDRHRGPPVATRAACRPGWSVPGWGRTTPRAACWPRCWPPTCRWSSTPTPSRWPRPSRRSSAAGAPRPFSPRTTGSSRGSGWRGAGGGGDDVGPDRVGAARRLAADLGCVVLLKGDATVVADPDGTASVNGTGTPWLATAGTGDVLRRHPRRAARDRARPRSRPAAVARTCTGGRVSSPRSGGPVVAGDLIRRLPDAISRVRGVPARRLGDSGA